MNETTRYLDLELEDLVVKVNEAVETTAGLGVTDRKTESISGTAGTQQAVNQEVVKAVKTNVQSEFSFTNSDTWTIDHKLNKRPCVKTVDANNNEIIGTIEYTTANNCVIHFAEKQSGKAYVN